MDPMAGLSGLFLSAFLSATLLPGNSEIALGALLVHDPSMHWRAIAVATTGNTLGGMTSYAIGRLVRSPQNNRTIRWLARYGLRCYFSHGSRLLVTRCVLPLAGCGKTFSRRRSSSRLGSSRVMFWLRRASRLSRADDVTGNGECASRWDRSSKTDRSDL